MIRALTELRRLQEARLEEAEAAEKNIRNEPNSAVSSETAEGNAAK